MRNEVNSPAPNPKSAPRPGTEQASSATGWRAMRGLGCVEPGNEAVIFAADYWHWIPFSKTPFLFAIGWISLRMRKVTWRSIGLTKCRSWRTTLLLGLLCGSAMEAFQLFVSQPALTRLTG